MFRPLPFDRRPRSLSVVPGAAILLVTLAWSDSPLAGVQGGSSSQLDDYLRSRALAGAFSGAAIVEHRGEVLLDRGYGRADFELDVPNDTSKIFRIGSLSKPFTAIAILELQEERELGIDDHLCRYLPVCPASWQPVLLKHLLSHTSGIPDYFGEVEAGPLSRMREVIGETVAAHLSSELVSSPGSAFRYSNFGYLLLGYVCEAAAHQPWEDVLRTRIFVPAGMSATGYDDVFAIVPGRAHGYTRSGAGALTKILYRDHGAFAAGGLRSTARDLLAWEHALFGGELLKSKSLEAMFTPVLDSYALGWQVTDLLGRRVVDHTGGIDGFSSHFVHYLDDDLTVILLSNVEDTPVKALACDLARIALRLGPPVLGPRGEVAVDACAAPSKATGGVP